MTTSLGEEWRLNPVVIFRPEAKGALLFNPEIAETTYLSRGALAFLGEILAGRVRAGKFPLGFWSYLQRAGIIQFGERNNGNGAGIIRECREAAIAEIPRSLSAPETLHLAVTDACDQECPGCFYSRRDGRPGRFMSRTLFAEVLRIAREVRVFQFAFGGGEPLLHPDLLDFAEAAKRAGIVPNITTNGNRLSPEMALALRAAGLGQLQISLDGATEKTGSRTRPNYAQSLRAMEVSRWAGLRFGINTLVTRDNFRGLPKVFSLAAEKGASGVNLLRPKPPTSRPGWLERSSLSPAEQRHFALILRRETRKRGIRITLDQSLSFLAGHRSADDLFENGVWGCGAGRRFLAIGPDGTVFPCSHFRQAVGTNGDFMDAWRNSPLLDKFRRLEETIKGVCGRCRLVSVCRGCRAVVTDLGSGFFDHDPHCPRLATT